MGLGRRQWTHPESRHEEIYALRRRARRAICARRIEDVIGIVERAEYSRNDGEEAREFEKQWREAAFERRWRYNGSGGRNDARSR